MTSLYVKAQNNQVLEFPYSIGRLRADNPGTSFPAEINKETLADFDVYPVISVPAPPCDSKTHRTERSVDLLNQEWHEAWQVVELPQDLASANIRAERNRRLADCDWTQLPDAPVDAGAWATYRQALRDISSQTGFPWNVTWPTEP